MKCHEVDYQIVGDDMQMVEIELDPGETVIAEAGAMNYMEDGIAFEARMGDGSKPDQGLMGKLFCRRQARAHRRIALHDPLHQPRRRQGARSPSPPPTPARSSR